MRFFNEALDLSIEEEGVDYVAELFTTQLLNSFDNTCNDIDYVKIKELTPKVHCGGLTCVLQNIQIVPLQSGKLVLGLDVIAKPDPIQTDVVSVFLEDIGTEMSGTPLTMNNFKESKR